MCELNLQSCCYESCLDDHRDRTAQAGIQAADTGRTTTLFGVSRYRVVSLRQAVNPLENV